LHEGCEQSWWLPLIADSLDVRDLLQSFFPSLEISAVANPSGQRVVYFARFKPSPNDDSRKHWHEWGAVVLKLSAGQDPTTLAYMQKEIEILKSLHSVYYPKLLYHDIFSEDPRTDSRLPQRLLVTIEERIDALPLTKVKNNYKSQSAVVLLLSKLVIALSLLWHHPQRLVHRDLKPDNILVKKDGSLVIIDLGILRETGAAGLTNTYAPFGPLSAPYASPEQAKNDKGSISYRSDFFALGTIAYELLTGANPFMPDQSMGFLEVLERVRTYDPKPSNCKCI
jgi:serine/threonine protein kinase